MRLEHICRQAHDMRAVHMRMTQPHDSAMEHRKALGRAIRYFRKRQGLGQEQLAEATEIDQGAISRIENGRQGVTDAQMIAIAKVLDIHVSELWAATEADDDAGMSQSAPPIAANARMVPLLGWVQAGSWTDPQAGDGHVEASDFVTTSTRVSRRSFALSVKGESMLNPRGEPSFPPGTRIIVDPERPASSGDLVIAQIDGEAETTFKRLVVDGGQQFLVPLNPQYPTLPIDRTTRICGVVTSIAEKPLTD